MARTVRDARLDTRLSRSKLKPRQEPYWSRLSKGCHLGYRRPAHGRGGSWIARYRTKEGRLIGHAIGPADDIMDADGAICFSFDQAQERARDWFRGIGAAATSQRLPETYTVADCIADYLAYIRAHKKSARHLETYAKAYIVPRLGRVNTADLTTFMIRDWHAKIAAEPPRIRTKKGQIQRYRPEDPNPVEARRKRQLRANRHLVMLRAALTRAWRDGLISDPERWTRVEPFKGVERQRHRFLEPAEATRLLNACVPDLRALVHLALVTGARYGELCALEVRDFQATSGTLFVRDSKSGKPRHIILNDEGIALCKSLCTGRSLGERILRREDGSSWARDLHSRPFKAAVYRAGIDPEFTFHELRHTWASLSIMAGAPLMVVAQNLGHRDTRMVEKHYGHLAQSYVVEMVRRTAPSFGFVHESQVTPFRPRA